MLNRIIIFILAFGIVYQTAYIKAAEINVNIISGLDKAAAEELSSEIIKNNIKIKKLVFSEHSSKDYFESIIYNSFISNNLIDTSVNITAKFEIFENNVYYQLYSPANDSLIRLNKLSFACKIFKNDTVVQYFKQIEKERIDTIARDDIDYLQSGELAFCTGSVPKRETGFFETIAAPLIITASAVLSVFLLFSVRTK